MDNFVEPMSHLHKNQPRVIYFPLLVPKKRERKKIGSILLQMIIPFPNHFNLSVKIIQLNLLNLSSKTSFYSGASCDSMV